MGDSGPYFCANHAPVTIESLSLSRPKNCGLSVMATTAFCTVLLVTSTGRCTSSLESICRVQEMPKTDVAAPFEFVRRRRVKYEKSSVALNPWSARRGVEGTEALRMGAIRQGHERQKGPVIVDGGIDAVFDAKPAFNLRSPA